MPATFEVAGIFSYIVDDYFTAWQAERITSLTVG